MLTLSARLQTSPPRRSLPSSLASSLPALKILFFFKNKFTKYPAVLGECKNLTMVSFKLNQIEEIEPEALQPQLRWLILTGNKVRSGKE